MNVVLPTEYWPRRKTIGFARISAGVRHAVANWSKSTDFSTAATFIWYSPLRASVMLAKSGAAYCFPVGNFCVTMVRTKDATRGRGKAGARGCLPIDVERLVAGEGSKSVG